MNRIEGAAPRCIDLAALAGVCAVDGAASAGSGAGAACSRTRGRGAAELARAFAAARLACFPTDTVYGVGGLCRRAVLQALWSAKGREPDKPLQVIFPSLPVLLATLALSSRLEDALRRLLPGPLTVVVPYPDGFAGPPPGRAEDGSPTLGVRVPRWPRAAVAMSWLAAPLVASSANPSGAPPPCRLEDVDDSIRGACDLLLDGGEVGVETGGLPSTVVDLSSFAETGRWRVLRPGAASTESIESRLAGVGAPADG